MKISLITIVFNAASTIEATLKSVISQTIFQEIEYIVIDGGSTDGSRAIIDIYTDNIAKKIFEPDNGLYDALNIGINIATGDVIGFIHADDVLADHKVLEHILNVFLRSNPDAVYGDLNYLDSSLNKVLRKWKSGKATSFSSGWMPPHPALYVKKSVFEKVGLFRMDMGSAADYEWMLRAIRINKIQLDYLPEVVVNMRIGGVSNKDIQARKNAFSMDVKAWEVNGLGKNFLAVVLKKLRKIPQYF